MKTLRLLIILFTWLFFLGSCIKINEIELDITDRYAMPSHSSFGANTFGCYINEEPYVGDIYYNAYFVGKRTFPVAKNYDGVTMGISAKDKEWKNSKLQFHFDFYDSTGYYELPEYTVFGTTKFIDNKKGSLPYHIILDEPHWVKVSGYRENEYISGTFSFTGVNKDAGDTVRVRDGRFDIAFE